MTAKITYFPVGNGDMTLIQLNDAEINGGSPTTILVDCCISENGGSECDVESELRNRLPVDGKGRPYVDVFCLSHPDEDHCRGLRNYFHLAPLSDYDDEAEKIVIREMWSSPLVFRRASKTFTLCEDAKAWRTEAKRRVELHRKRKNQGKGSATAQSGDRILLIGKDLDKNNKARNADIPEIVRNIDTEFSDICGNTSEYITMHILGPLPKGEVNDDEETLASNRSSIIMRYHIRPKANDDNITTYLTGGDAHVAVWERLWKKHNKTPENLAYDILLSPHHCSWRVLSDCSWSDGCRDINADARNALSQIEDGGTIIASSKPIKEEDADPPCVGAANEYKSIVNEVNGEFLCTGKHPSEKNPEPLEITINSNGHQPQGGTGRKSRATGSSSVVITPAEHG